MSEQTAESELNKPPAPQSRVVSPTPPIGTANSDATDSGLPPLRLNAAEQEQHKSWQLIALALDAAGMGWGAWNLATGRAEVDARTRALLGFGPDKDQITLASWLEQVEAEDRLVLEAAIRAGAESGDALDTIFRVMASDGTWRHLHASGTFIIDKQRREPQLTSILRDETERLRNEQAVNEARASLEGRVAERTRELQAANAELTATRDRFTALFNTSPVPTVILDPSDGVFLDANPAFLDFLGMPREQVIGHLPVDLLHALPDYDDPDAIYDEFVRTGRVRDLETTFMVRPGDERTVLLSFVLLTLDGRNVLMSTLSDFTERKRIDRLIAQQRQSLAEANTELAAARDHFQTLFHANPVPSVILRIDDLVAVDANQAFLAFHDLPRESIVGRSVLDLVAAPAESDRDAMAALYRRQRGLRDQEMVIRLLNGEERTVLISDSPIRLQDQRCTLATLIDITQRKQAEEQTRHFASQLSLAEQAERQRIAAILHDDLQQRLFALQVRLASASAWVGQGETAAAASEVAQMRRALTNAIDLTRRLTVDLSPPILQGEGLYHAIVWLGSHMKEEYGLELTVQLETGWQPIDQGLRVALFQIVRELLFNVVKHAGVGTAMVTLSQTAQAVTLVVRDTGVGFDAERAATSGQGLRQARQRVELYSGHLTLDTRPGAGTAVTLTIPLST